MKREQRKQLRLKCLSYREYQMSHNITSSKQSSGRRGYLCDCAYFLPVTLSRTHTDGYHSRCKHNEAQTNKFGFELRGQKQRNSTVAKIVFTITFRLAHETQDTHPSWFSVGYKLRQVFYQHYETPGIRLDSCSHMFFHQIEFRFVHGSSTDGEYLECAPVWCHLLNYILVWRCEYVLINISLYDIYNGMVSKQCKHSCRWRHGSVAHSINSIDKHIYTVCLPR